MKTPISPKPTDDGAFSPSWLALKLATSDVTDYEPLDSAGSDDVPSGKEAGKVLMICTEQRNMTMRNGKRFSTGNHPVEMLLPMMHLTDAGFDIDIVTPSGAPVQIEQWAMPTDDAAVMQYHAGMTERFEHPGTVADALERLDTDPSYVAVFLPGGHGAMLGLPDDPDVGAVLRWFHDHDRHTLAICHGPAALLAMQRTADGTERDAAFAFAGYEIAAFPDKVDRQTPLIGYMPGHLPWKFGERLESLGVSNVNTKADDTCHVDRRLVTGASPEAANDFGRLAARVLRDHARS